MPTPIESYLAVLVLARLLFPFPPSQFGIPDAIAEQPIQVGKVRVAVDEEAQAFAIVLARPLAVPRLPPRIVLVEVQAAECLPAAMVTAFDIAARAMALADRRAAIGTGHSDALISASSSLRSAGSATQKWRPYTSTISTCLLAQDGQQVTSRCGQASDPSWPSWKFRGLRIVRLPARHPDGGRRVELCDDDRRFSSRHDDSTLAAFLDDR